MNEFITLLSFLLTIESVIMDNERLNELSGKILDAAIEVHRILGPGLLGNSL